MRDSSRPNFPTSDVDQTVESTSRLVDWEILTFYDYIREMYEYSAYEDFYTFDNDHTPARWKDYVGG